MAKDSMDLLEPLRKRGEDVDMGFLREALRVVRQGRIMQAEVSAQIGAEYGVPNQSRLDHRNGYRHREGDARIGSVELPILTLKEGRHFPPA